MVYGRTIKHTLKLLQSKHSFKLLSKKKTTKLEVKPYDARKFFAVSNDDIDMSWPRIFPDQIQRKTK